MDAPVGRLHFSVSEDAHACVQLLSRVQLFATPWTAACQAPLSMGFPSKNIGVVAICFSRASGDRTLLHWQADSLLLSQLQRH